MADTDARTRNRRRQADHAALRRWVIDRLRLETWDEETEDGPVRQEIIGFGSGL